MAEALNEARSIYVPGSTYGKRKARKHAQAEANRTGKRTFLQFEEHASGLCAHLTHGRLALLNAPFLTYYPQAQTNGS